MRPAPPHRRFPDWPQRLAEIVEARRETPFAWGVHDCCMWAADVTRALAGWDPLEIYRGAYASEEEAATIIGEQGLGDFVAKLMADHGAQEYPPAFATRGDWMLVNPGNEPMIGVVVGATIAVTGLEGLRFLPLHTARRAWAV